MIRNTVLTLAAASPLALLLIAAPSPSHESPNPSLVPVAAQPEDLDLGAILFEALENSEGCLGTIGAQTGEGHTCIIAWFENKQAVETWYYSRTHARMMRMMGSGTDTKQPLEHVKDETSPIMVMASITFGSEQVIPGTIPASQISIELYTPLDAGASVNGRLMPDEIVLPHFSSVDVLKGSPKDG